MSRRIPGSLSDREGPSFAPNIGAILSRVTASLGIDSQVDDRQILNSWEEIAGPSIAKKSRAKSLQDGTLVVEVSNSAWIQELSMLQSMLLKRARAKGGKVEKIIFVNRGEEDR